METRASHVLVGLFVLVLSVAAAAFAFWSGRVELERAVARYEIVFTESVTGLQVGSQVTYRGIPAGRVTDIRIDPERTTQILGTVELDPTIPVTNRTFAQLAPQGITGIFNVELLSDSGFEGPTVSIDEGAQIPARPSTLQRLASDAPELVAEAAALVREARQLLRPENIERISNTLANIELLSTEIANRRQQVGEVLDAAGGLVDDVRATLAGVDRVIGSVERTALAVEEATGPVVADVGAGLDEFRGALKSAGRAADQMDRMVRELREPTRDFAQTGLYDLSLLISESRQLVAATTRIAREFERDPAGFLLGGSFKGFQAE